MTYQPLDIDQRGVTLTLPEPDEIRCRPVAFPDSFVLELGPLCAWPTLEHLIRLQAETTRALCLAGYAAECLTPQQVSGVAG